LFAAVSHVLAADWPQWRGPHRDGIAQEKGLLKEWPKEGPNLLWTFRDAGAGFSSFAVVGDRLYSCGADEKNEFLFAVDTKDGSKLWSVEIGKRLDNGWGDGPRGTPTYDNGRLYVISGMGDLVCVKADKGDKLWSVNLTDKAIGGGRPGWGFTESPLVDGDRVVCTPGGGKGTFAAFEKKTGDVIWRSKDLKDGAAYSSIIIAEMAGIRQYVNMTSNGVAAVSATDGALLWQSDAARNGTAIIPTPIFHDSHVFVTSGYGAGCGLVKLTADGNKVSAEKVYTNKDMDNQHGGVILVDGCVYGYADSKGWVCMDFKTGAVKWANRANGKGSLAYADGHLFCYSEGKGTVALADAASEAWKETGRLELPEKTKLPRKSGQIWAHPVVANGKLFLRDQDLIFCYDVKGK
jgi:outer membrane protein assembly factor BamB